MKRFLFIIFFLIVLYSLFPMDMESTLISPFSKENFIIDFSNTDYNNDVYSTWEIIFFPSLKKVKDYSIKQVALLDPVFKPDEDSNTNEANQGPGTVMEVAITFSKVPEGTKGVLIRPSVKTSFSVNNTINTAIENIGILKIISVTLSCNNYANGFGILLENQVKDQNIYLFPGLDFKGWKTLKWENRNYIEEIRQREVTKLSLFPRDIPSLKFMGFIIYYSEENKDKKLVLELKEVRIEYDTHLPDWKLKEIYKLYKACDIK